MKNAGGVEKYARSQETRRNQNERPNQCILGVNEWLISKDVGRGRLALVFVKKCLDPPGFLLRNDANEWRFGCNDQ